MTQSPEENSLVPDTTRTADDSDRATDLEMMLTEDLVREARKRAVQHQLPVNGEYLILDCLTCGEEIGEGRLRVAVKNTCCVECVTLEEKLAKRRA